MLLNDRSKWKYLTAMIIFAITTAYMVRRIYSPLFTCMMLTFSISAWSCSVLRIPSRDRVFWILNLCSDSHLADINLWVIRKTGKVPILNIFESYRWSLCDVESAGTRSLAFGWVFTFTTLKHVAEANCFNQSLRCRNTYSSPPFTSIFSTFSLSQIVSFLG